MAKVTYEFDENEEGRDIELINSRYKMICALNDLSDLKRKLYKGWLSEEDLINVKDNRVLQKFAAAKFIRSIPQISLEDQSCFPMPIREAFKELAKQTSKYLYWRDAYNSSEDARAIIDMIPPEKFDAQIMALWNICKPWAELGFRLNNKAYLHSTSMSNLCSYYILMKEKKFRLDWQFYKDMKEHINNLLEII